MRTYLCGEVIDILPGKVCILLEGFLKQLDNDEIIAAPALAFLDDDLSKTGTLSHALYRAETRSQILVMDLPALHEKLQNASNSFLSSKRAFASCSSFEQGLMHSQDTCHPYEPRMGNLFLRVSEGSHEPLPCSPKMSKKSMQIECSEQRLPHPETDQSSSAKRVSKRRKESVDSGDASDRDEEHIVCIDSASSFFHHSLCQ